MSTTAHPQALTAQQLDSAQQNFHRQAALGPLLDCYLNRAVVCTGGSEIHSRKALGEQLLAELQTFDEREVLQQQVLGPTAAAGALASRSSVAARHSSASVFGPASGAAVELCSLALHLHSGGRIYREYRIVDRLLLAQQLAVDPQHLARRQVAAGSAVYWSLGEVNTGLGQLPPPPTAVGVEQLPQPCRRPAQLLHQIWNLRQLQLLPQLYSDDTIYHGPGGSRQQGVPAVRQACLKLLAAMPDAALFFQHAAAGEVEADGSRSMALLWRLLGTHRGPGFTPAPSAARLHVQGISQLRLRGDKVVEEWTLYDEIAVLRDIFLYREAVARAQLNCLA